MFFLTYHKYDKAGEDADGAESILLGQNTFLVTSLRGEGQISSLPAGGVLSLADLDPQSRPPSVFLEPRSSLPS